MMHRATFACGLVFVALVVFSQVPCASREEKTNAAKWEYKAVAFGSDEKVNTKKLNHLAADGWKYVGPLGNGMVAFRRRAVRGTLRITILGDKEAKNNAFYLLEGEKTPRTFDGLTGRLKEQLNKGGARRVELRLTSTSPAKKSPIVGRLSRWLEESGLKWSVVQD